MKITNKKEMGIIIFILSITLIIELSLIDLVYAVPNPSSIYCYDNGFKIKLDDEGSVGYCIFDDDTACEEWSYYHKECGPNTNNSYDFYDELEGPIISINEIISKDGSITYIDADYCINKSGIIKLNKQKLVNHLMQYYISEGGRLIETYRVDIMNISCCNNFKKISCNKPLENGSCPSPRIDYQCNICSNCGNKICEEWENKCNCPEDCEDIGLSNLNRSYNYNSSEQIEEQKK